MTKSKCPSLTDHPPAVKADLNSVRAKILPFSPSRHGLRTGLFAGAVDIISGPSRTHGDGLKTWKRVMRMSSVRTPFFWEEISSGIFKDILTPVLKTRQYHVTSFRRGDN